MTIAVPETAGWPAIPRAWRLAALLAWIAGMATVALFSLSSHLGPPEGPGLDKIVHFLGYMTLALQAQPAFATRRAALIAALAMIPFGLAMEYGQDYVPGRYADGFDAVANTIGAAMGIALAPAFRRLCAEAVARLNRRS